MRLRWMIIWVFAALGGCSWLTGEQSYSVYFQPYSSDPDQQARKTIRDAADFAQDHPLESVVVTGFAAPADPKLDIPGLSLQRAESVKKLLIEDGVLESHIETVSNGVTDPKTLPSVAVRRVDISVGQ